MKTSNRRSLRIVLPLVLSFCPVVSRGPLPLAAAQSAAKPAEKEPATQAATDREQSALNDAFQSAENNPQILIRNLEAFLERFPQSSRRKVVLRTICNYALQANAPDVAVRYGQMLLAITPDDPQLLTLLIEVSGRQSDQASRLRAIDYTSRLISIAENQRDRTAAAGGGRDTREQWAARIAALYAQRAGFYRDSGDLEKAVADEEKSYATYATARVAEQLGDAALKKGDSTRAMDYYLTAFVFPDKDLDAARRQEIRRKLGSLYVGEHHSKKGLGDLVLARYDTLMSDLAERFPGDQSPNAGRSDPFEFVLNRMDGSPLPLANYRGKVMVMDFWATWCGPCRLQGKLFEQVAATFRADSNTVFLSLNVDQDRSGVPAFLKQQGWTLPVACDQGLEQLLMVRELPTLVIFDRQGQVVFRQEGLNPGSFAEQLTKHVRETLREPVSSRQ
jgi:thiol-disulfide isomerase/thioredoxin/tetratricopeptide (TPR) repeat protein